MLIRVFSLLLIFQFLCLGIPSKGKAAEIVELQFESLESIEGTQKWDWWQARTAYIPNSKPFWITTMSETGKSGSHDFHDIYETISHDRGRTWSKPSAINSLKRVKQADGYEVAPGDLWPTWHAKTGTVLITGKTFNFAKGTQENRLREKIFYAVLDPVKNSYGPMSFLAAPEKDHSGHPIVAPNAGCTQRVDLPNGDILLPVRYWRNPKHHNYTSVVMRCSYDGKTLLYKEHGSELTIPQGRGLYEPSLIEFKGEYFLTMRADHSAYVARSKDGLNFEPIREWTFDDGQVLGNYKTQQHWVSISGGLFLVYTRRGANNDHIMRHRAPLFIGQVDAKTLQVIRSTERILIPEDQATLGNSGICRISENESWVTCGEGLLRLGKRKGQNNKVLVVKITSKGEN